jgi:hypothetical protein
MLYEVLGSGYSAWFAKDGNQVTYMPPVKLGWAGVLVNASFDTRRRDVFVVRPHVAEKKKI